MENFYLCRTKKQPVIIMNNAIPNRLFIRNRANLAAQMPPKSVAVFTANEAMPRNGDEFYPFRQQSDFFYLTGIDEENAYLIIAPDYPDETMREVLFIEPYDEVKATWQGEMLNAEQATELSGIKSVKGSDAFWMTLNDIVFSGYGDTLFLNSYEYPKYECAVETIQKRFVQQVKTKYPMHNYGRTAPILNALRMKKSEDEIAITQQACNITAKAFRRCLATVKPGMYEYEVQAEIEYIFKQNNATGHAYAPIIAGGKNGCCLHYSKNQSLLNDGDLLLFDIGCGKVHTKTGRLLQRCAPRYEGNHQTLPSRRHHQRNQRNHPSADGAGNDKVRSLHRRGREKTRPQQAFGAQVPDARHVAPHRS